MHFYNGFCESGGMAHGRGKDQRNTLKLLAATSVKSTELKNGTPIQKQTYTKE
jgi:hypothetical protein